MGFHGGLEVLRTKVLDGGYKLCNHPILYIPFLVIKPS